MINRRKTQKKVFDFTVLVVGDEGLGCDSLIGTIFGCYSKVRTNEIDEQDCVKRKVPHFSNQPSIEIELSTYEFDIEKLKWRFSVAKALNYASAIDGTSSWLPIKTYIEEQFEVYLKDESGFDRINIVDNRVHCLLFLINPNLGHLRLMDIEFLKSVCNKVCILPVIPKADVFTPEELAKVKSRINKQMTENEISIYPFPEFDPEESSEFNSTNEHLKGLVPFATICVGGDSSLNSENFQKKYRWGTYDVSTFKTNDLLYLRQMLTNTHCEDLKMVTEQIHYESYRVQRLGGNKNTNNQETA